MCCVKRQTEYQKVDTRIDDYSGKIVQREL
jgi:hypothetical protein